MIYCVDQSFVSSSIFFLDESECIWSENELNHTFSGKLFDDVESLEKFHWAKLWAKRNRILDLVKCWENYSFIVSYCQLLVSAELVSGTLAHWPMKSFTRLYNFSIITYWKLERRGSVSSDWGFLFKLRRLKIDI